MGEQRQCSRPGCITRLTTSNRGTECYAHQLKARKPPGRGVVGFGEFADRAEEFGYPYGPVSESAVGSSALG